MLLKWACYTSNALNHPVRPTAVEQGRKVQIAGAFASVRPNVLHKHLRKCENSNMKLDLIHLFYSRLCHFTKVHLCLVWTGNCKANKTGLVDCTMVMTKIYFFIYSCQQSTNEQKKVQTSYP